MLRKLKYIEQHFDVTRQTLISWIHAGLLPYTRTPGGQFRVDTADIEKVLYKQNATMTNTSKPLLNRIVVGYVRVSSQKQSDDLLRQEEHLKTYLLKLGEPFKIVSDIGSGLNYKRQGLLHLLELINSNQVSQVVVLHKDRLIRFGAELIEEFCKLHDTTVTYVDQTEKSEEQELVEDLLSIVHVFSCRLNGKRSNKMRKFMADIKNENP